LTERIVNGFAGLKGLIKDLTRIEFKKGGTTEFVVETNLVGLDLVEDRNERLEGLLRGLIAATCHHLEQIVDDDGQVLDGEHLRETAKVVEGGDKTLVRDFVFGSVIDVEEFADARVLGVDCGNKTKIHLKQLFSTIDQVERL